VPAALFDAYREIRPLDPGFGERQELWRIFAYLAVLNSRPSVRGHPVHRRRRGVDPEGEQGLLADGRRIDLPLQLESAGSAAGCGTGRPRCADFRPWSMGSEVLPRLLEGVCSGTARQPLRAT